MASTKNAQEAIVCNSEAPAFRPLPVIWERPKIVRESAYIEQSLSEFLGEYAMRAGMSKSHALRRLMILGAMSEGHVFDGGTVTDTNADAEGAA